MRAPVTSIAVVLMLWAAPAALGRGELDQTTLPGNSNTGLVVGNASTGPTGYAAAQTFTAGRTGYLDALTLAVDSPNPDGRYRLNIESAGAGGPTGTVLATRTLDGCRLADGQGAQIAFGPAAQVTTGQRYAITLVPIAGSSASTNPSPAYLTWSAGGAYDRGAAFSRTLDTTAWQPPDPSAPGDLGMSTYVAPTAPAALARAATTVTVTSGRNPAPPGETTFTATVRDPAHAGVVPAGTVAFRRDSNGFTVSAPLDGQGRATYTADLGQGSMIVTATYCPSSDAHESSSGALTQTVTQDQTAISVSSAPNPTRVGEPVELTARVTVPGAPTKNPTGTVQFDVDGAVVGAPVVLVNGVATATTTQIPAGAHQIVARYRSDDGFFSNVTGVSTHTANRWSSQSTVTVAPDPTVAGQPATFTATVSGQAVGGRRPTGTVRFTDDDGSTIGPPVELDAQGVARTDARAVAGIYRVRADYSGDGYFEPSSSHVGQTVQRAATTTTLTSSSNPAAAGSAIVFTATVSVAPPGDIGAYGSLQITVNGAPLGDPISLDGYEGITLTARAPDVAGTDTVGVAYSGDENTLPSSASLTQVVLAPPTLLPTIPRPASSPTPTVTRTDLKRMTAPLLARLKQRGARSLGSARQTLTVATPGTLQQTVRAGSLIASTKRTFTAAGTAVVALRLTAAGRRQVRRGATLKLTIVTTFTPSAGAPVSVTERVTARRGKPRAAAAWRVVGVDSSLKRRLDRRVLNR